ncbi:hypothetical protein [Mycobacterium avium]|uniref:Uncharacterized protein n=1 Tax=Mycobacterium avium subsp. hominissuis TaxID=439334 RepID=A0AAI8SSV1_MYCAV|nr:hypothetical protein [Mycobacterium avium]PBA08645.1 hypothetical protein CKJ70_25300 [Mycobacterium avium]BBN50824.1 hypothetical protein JPH1_52990 [Mycobacterium avium subsp. hominissuis]
MGRPSARTVAIRDQILAALRAEWPLPVSTRRICELLGAHRYDETGYRVYPQLCALDRLGVVERIRRGAECRDVFWRFLGDPTDADLSAAVDATDPTRPASEAPTDSADELEVDTETILSTLDSYIKALDEGQKRFVKAAASGDQDDETDAADDLAALVRQFVDVCNNWPAPASTNSDSPK